MDTRILRQNTSIGARKHWTEDTFVHDLIDTAGPVVLDPVNVRS